MNESCQVVAPVFQEYKDKMARFIKSRVSDPVDQDELLSEVMIKLYDNCEKLEHIRKTEAWLITVTRNTINDYFRAKQKTVVAFVPESDDSMDKEEKNLVEGLVDCIPSLIERLPEKYAIPLRQHELEGISQKELANIYQMSESGMKSRIQRGRKQLKGLFRDYCGHLIDEPERSCGDCTD